LVRVQFLRYGHRRFVSAVWRLEATIDDSSTRGDAPLMHSSRRRSVFKVRVDTADSCQRCSVPQGGPSDERLTPKGVAPRMHSYTIIEQIFC